MSLRLLFLGGEDGLDTWMVVIDGFMTRGVIGRGLNF